MRDNEDIFRRLKKETPLVKRKDLQPLSGKDFTPKRSAFDMLVEKANDKREERRSGYRTKPGSYQKSGGNDSERASRAKQEGLSLYGDAARADTEHVQRPQSRAIQARSETHIRGEAEPLRRPEIRTAGAQPFSPQRIEPERAPRPENRTAAPRPQNPLQEDTRSVERPQPHAAAPQASSREYAEPARTRMSSVRKAYAHADAAELEIFSEAAPKRKAPARADSLTMAPMRRERTEFDEYFEPAQDSEAQPAFRHELKYYINYTEYIVLRNTLKALAQLDKYAGENGEYYIRSLYFDGAVAESALDLELGIFMEMARAYRQRVIAARLDLPARMPG
jgi:hypothetical protein